MHHRDRTSRAPDATWTTLIGKPKFDATNVGVPGRMDLKAFVLFRDGSRCRRCGTRVTHETSQADHIQPVSSFASYEQATTLENLQTLCLECHKMKTYRSNQDSLESRMQ